MRATSNADGWGAAREFIAFAEAALVRSRHARRVDEEDDADDGVETVDPYQGGLDPYAWGGA